jgi:hypothetical protein
MKNSHVADLKRDNWVRFVFLYFSDGLATALFRSCLNLATFFDMDFRCQCRTAQSGIILARS